MTMAMFGGGGEKRSRTVRGDKRGTGRWEADHNLSLHARWEASCHQLGQLTNNAAVAAPPAALFQIAQEQALHLGPR